VQFKVVKGASPERIVLQADRSLIQPFIEAGHTLISNGAKILTTSCGFLALFHKELIQALNVPVFSSSLLQIQLARSIIKKGQKVGVITARKKSLSKKHFAAIGVDHHGVEIIGMEESEEFSSVFMEGKKTLDIKKCGKEMQKTALRLIQQSTDIGAIVLECTNMPPYSKIVHRATGNLPVFDMVTMINYAYSTIKYK